MAEQKDIRPPALKAEEFLDLWRMSRGLKNSEPLDYDTFRECRDRVASLTAMMEASMCDGVLLVGGPTVGKSYLASQLAKLSVSPWLLDSDVWVEKYFPQWFKSRLWRHMDSDSPGADAIHSLLNATVGCGMRREWLDQGRGLLLSNLWHPAFINNLLYGSGFADPSPDQRVIGTRGTLFVFRDSGESIHRISKQRGDEIPVRLANSWVKSAKRYGPEVFGESNCYFLSENEFISDVVKPLQVNGSWRWSFHS